jgi:hypothetical protein
MPFVSITDENRFLCPYDWHDAKLEDAMAVSSGLYERDPVLLENAKKRFHPTRFTPKGQALDEAGAPTVTFACPRCHMILPREALINPFCTLSVVGAPAVGKSVFLAAATHQVRNLLRPCFGLDFSDLDPIINDWLIKNENLLFAQSDTHKPVAIGKNAMDTSTYREIEVDGQQEILPNTALFRIAEKGHTRRVLALCDHSGEIFHSTDEHRIRHSALHLDKATALLFLFDPFADAGLQTLLDKGAGDDSNIVLRQDQILNEMYVRLRAHQGSQGENLLKTPLIFGVSKADTLYKMLPSDVRPIRQDAKGKTVLDLDEIARMSAALRALLVEHTRGMVNVLESLVSNVVYMPISALGHNPKRGGYRPCDIRPFWAEVPLLYTLAQPEIGLVPTTAARKLEPPAGEHA